MGIILLKITRSQCKQEWFSSVTSCVHHLIALITNVPLGIGVCISSPCNKNHPRNCQMNCVCFMLIFICLSCVIASAWYWYALSSEWHSQRPNRNGKAQKKINYKELLMHCAYQVYRIRFRYLNNISEASASAQIKICILRNMDYDVDD